MNDKFVNPSTIRKRKSRENETSDHYETRLANQREKRRQKKEEETDKERDARREYEREKKRRRLAYLKEKSIEYCRKLRSQAGPCQPQQEHQATSGPQQPQQEVQEDQATRPQAGPQQPQNENPSELS